MAPAQVVIAHRAPGRIRLRVAGPHGDARLVENLATGLGRCPGVREVEVNARTGSILLHHDTEPEAIVEFGSTQDLFSISSGGWQAPLLPSAAARLAFQTLDKRLRRRTEGTWDFREVAFFLLTVGGVVQLARQNFWPAGLTLFWYATTLLDRKGENSARM